MISLFEAVPPDPGMAFVVILHLSRDHQSNVAAILQRVTPMPVAQVTASVPIEAGFDAFQVKPLTEDSLRALVQ